MDAGVQTGGLRLQLMLESDERSAFIDMPLFRIIEIRADKNVLLDTEFIPPSLDCRAVPRLHGFLEELQGLLHHRAEALAGRITESGRGGAAEIADFMMLQAVNRLEPLFTHFVDMTGLHPEEFYRIGGQVAGELSTFTAQGKRPGALPPYRHDDLQMTFNGLMAALRQSLSMVLEQNAIAIPLQERKYGIYVAVVPDPSCSAVPTSYWPLVPRWRPMYCAAAFPPRLRSGRLKRFVTSSICNCRASHQGLCPWHPVRSHTMRDLTILN